jgi:hypothetical protein
LPLRPDPAPSDFLNVLLGCGTIHPNGDASPNIAAGRLMATLLEQVEDGVRDALDPRAKLRVEG